jgi:hypothetical protein
MSDRDPPPTLMPASRDLNVIIAACDLVASELAFQAYRLENHVAPRTADEVRHFAQMKEEYESAAKTTRKLMKYTERRLRRAEERGTLEQASFDSSVSIDGDGRAQAFTDDEDAPV